MGLFDFLSKHLSVPDKTSKKRKRASGPQEEILDGVEQAIKLLVPQILRVSGYRKKLAPAVERTLSYADEVVGQIPGPVELDERSWAEDTLVNTLFAGVDQFRDFFSSNKELAKFFGKSNAGSCYALLTMERLEKRILVVEKHGEIIKRDVPKTAVNFDDHRIVAPMASEREAKREVSARALAVLIDHVCEEIMFLKRWEEDLEREKRILEAQIELSEATRRDIDSLLGGAVENYAKIAEAKELVKQMERKIYQVRSEVWDPRDCLSKVTEVLTTPESYLRAQPVRMRLGDMGIKITESEATDAREIQFCEFSLESRPKRSAVFIRCPRKLIAKSESAR